MNTLNGMPARRMREHLQKHSAWYKYMRNTTRWMLVVVVVVLSKHIRDNNIECIYEAEMSGEKKRDNKKQSTKE